MSRTGHGLIILLTAQQGGMTDQFSDVHTDSPLRTVSTVDAPDIAVVPVPPVSKSSWWNYVGLGEKEQMNVSTATQEQEVASAIENAGNASPSLLSTVVPEPQTSVSAVDLLEKPSSTLSAQSTSSAWYSPWGWYDWYAGPGDVDSQEPALSKSEAELIKEEALARPDRPQELSGPIMEDVTSAPEPMTPIVSTLASNSKGWASFFSSTRVLATKTVIEKVESGMEVMNIEDEETRPPSRNVENFNDNTGNGNSVDLKGSVAAKAPSVKQTESASSNTKEDMSGVMTKSENVKRKVTDAPVNGRTASPTPSKKSIPPPNKPRVPNLVLPTFDDTFRSLPRSRMFQPNMQTSSLRKTIGYVTSVLFARDQNDTGTEAKGKARAQELDDFGKELPRAWDVFGEVPPLKSCRKVVVIGVHGWFPGYAVRTVFGEVLFHFQSHVRSY